MRTFADILGAKPIRLRTIAIFIAVTVAMLIGASLLPNARILATSQWMILAVMTLNYCAIMYWIVAVPAYDSALIGGWLGVLFGGGMPILVCPSGQQFDGTVLFFLACLSAVGAGLVITCVWSAAGVVVAWGLSIVFKRHGFWSGVVCGAVVGVPVSFDRFGLTTSMIHSVLMLAACGGWGADMQTNRLRTPDPLPEKIDEWACQAVVNHPSPWRGLTKRASFRVRKVLELPSRIRRHGP